MLFDASNAFVKALLGRLHLSCKCSFLCRNCMRLIARVATELCSGQQPGTMSAMPGGSPAICLSVCLTVLSVGRSVCLSVCGSPSPSNLCLNDKHVEFFLGAAKATATPACSLLQLAPFVGEQRSSLPFCFFQGENLGTLWHPPSMCMGHSSALLARERTFRY